MGQCENARLKNAMGKVPLKMFVFYCKDMKTHLRLKEIIDHAQVAANMFCYIISYAG